MISEISHCNKLSLTCIHIMPFCNFISKYSILTVNFAITTLNPAQNFVTHFIISTILLSHLSLSPSLHLSPIRSLFWHVKCILKLRLSNCLTFLAIATVTFNSIYLHAFFNYKKNAKIMFISGKNYMFVFPFFALGAQLRVMKNAMEKLPNASFLLRFFVDVFMLLRLLCALKYATLYNTQAACVCVALCALKCDWHELATSNATNIK